MSDKPAQPTQPRDLPKGGGVTNTPASPQVHVDPDLVDVACRLADCTPEQLLVVRQQDDGSLVVVVQPGPKYVYSPQQVADAVKGSRTTTHREQLSPKHDTPPKPRRP